MQSSECVKATCSEVWNVVIVIIRQNKKTKGLLLDLESLIIHLASCRLAGDVFLYIRK